MTDEFTNGDGSENLVREAFARSLENQEGAGYPHVLHTKWIDTPFGTMLGVGDDESLYMLLFIGKSSLLRKTGLLQKKLGAKLEMGDTPPLLSIAGELGEYFGGGRRLFETPLALVGTAFQKKVWTELRKVPFGQTVSYGELAERIGRPSAFRAVAQTCGQNPLAIVVPCHRLTNAGGGMGGYSAGQERKQWILDFEKKELAKEVRQPSGVL